MTDKLWRKLCSELQIRGWKEGQMCIAFHYDSQRRNEQCMNCGSLQCHPIAIPPPDQTDKAVLWEVAEKLANLGFIVSLGPKTKVGLWTPWDKPAEHRGYWQEFPDLLTAAVKALGIDS